MVAVVGGVIAVAVGVVVAAFGRDALTSRLITPFAPVEKLAVVIEAALEPGVEAGIDASVASLAAIVLAAVGLFEP